MPPSNGPAAFQLTQLLSELNRNTQVFSERSKPFETVANSLDSLNKMFQSSKIFKKANVRFMSQFYKKAPSIYKKLTSSIENLTQAFTNGDSGGPGPGPTPRTEGTQFMGDLLEQLNRLGGSITGLGGEINTIETTANLNDESQGRITGLHSDLTGLQDEMMEIMRSVASSSEGAGGAADQIDNLNGDLSEMVRQFSILTQEGQINSDTYFEMIRRLNNVNSRLSTTQGDLSEINDELRDTVANQEAAADGIERSVSAMVALQALELIQGANIGEVEDQISSLNDELIDLQKTMGGVDMPIDEWRKSSIEAAKAFNAMNVAADPAEMANLYSIIGKTGARTPEIVKSLANSVKLVTEATDIGAEDAAEFGYTLADSWELGIDFVDKYNSVLVKMQNTSNNTANDIMSKTKEMGDTFQVVLRDLDQQGKETFMVGMASSLGALESGFIKDTDLIKEMALSLTDMPGAAEKFADMLQGTGYNVQQMAEDLKKGDPTKAVAAIFEGSKKFNTMSGEQLNIAAERSGKTVNQLVEMGKHAGEVLKSLAEIQKSSMEEIANPKSLIQSAQLEHKKLGNIFTDLGKKIKTWISDVGIGAIEGLGVEMLDLAPTIAPLVIILDKFGFKLGKIGEVAKSSVKYIWNMSYGMVSFLATSISSIGVMGTLEVILSAASAQMHIFGVSIYAALGPVGLIILGIVAIGAAIYTLVKWGPVLWNWFGEKFPNAAKAIEKAFSPIGKMFIKMWDIIKHIGMMLGKIIGTVIVGAFKIWWAIAKVLAKVMITFFKLLGAIAEPVIKLIGEGLSWLWEKFSGSDAVKESQESFNGWITGAKLMIGGIKNIADGIIGFFDDISSNLDSINEDFDLFITWIGSGFVKLGETISSWASNLGGIIMAPFNYVYDKLSSFVGFVKTIFSDFATVITDALTTPFDFIGNLITSVVDKIQGLLGLGGALKGIAGFFGFGKKEPEPKTTPQETKPPKIQKTEVNTILNSWKDTQENKRGVSITKGIAKGVVPQRSARSQMKYDLRRQEDMQEKIRANKQNDISPKRQKSELEMTGKEWNSWMDKQEKQGKGPSKILAENSAFTRMLHGESPEESKNISLDRAKVIEPEPSKKIFAENPEIIIKPGTELDVHQEDVVAAIRDLTSVMKKGQRQEDQNTRRPNMKVRPTDEQAELAREWAL